jgi:hypothetical protein
VTTIRRRATSPALVGFAAPPGRYEADRIQRQR